MSFKRSWKASRGSKRGSSNKKASINQINSARSSQFNKRNSGSKKHLGIICNIDDIEAYFSTPLPSQTKRPCNQFEVKIAQNHGHGSLNKQKGLGFVSETSTNHSSSAISTYSEGSGAGIFKNTGSSFVTGLQLGFIFPKAD